MNDFRIIYHNDGRALYLVVDERAHPISDVLAALARPDVPPDTRRLLAAADALRDAALALPKAVTTYQIRAALAQYRTARKKVIE